ncbi:MAG: hypothetical protein U1E02_43045 [Hydrogenophaga sp.]|nr:hypothetical protein [Hydrogenophaga sp.]
MTNDEYLGFEGPFRELAKPLMEQLRKTLSEAGYGEMEPVEVVDKDISRGLGFQSTTQPDLFVELMLEDGGEHGYEGVGLYMIASIWGDGVVWSPGNYTEDVAITSVEELRQRFDEVDVGSIALLSMRAWNTTCERRTAVEVSR